MNYLVSQYSFYLGRTSQNIGEANTTDESHDEDMRAVLSPATNCRNIPVEAGKLKTNTTLADIRPKCNPS